MPTTSQVSTNVPVLTVNLSEIPALLDAGGINKYLAPIGLTLLYELATRGEIQTASIGMKRGKRVFVTASVVQWLQKRMLSDRMDYNRAHCPDLSLDTMEAEHCRLVLMLSGPDYYRQWCKDPTDDDERQAKKVLINSLLNMPNRKIVNNGFYQWMKRTFPTTLGITEAIKRKDHRNLSKELQRFTSNAINDALLDLQKEGIAAIPQTDAIICCERDQERVREVIGKHVFRESSGVRCKVNGILTNP